jgi:uncharacterized protein YndB with AHSA1/START domain
VPRCRPETIAFTATAPLCATVVRELPDPPERVFTVLADAPGWADWFPGMRTARWTSPGPHGVGSTREVTVGPVRVDEEFLVWEPGERFAFTFLASNLPLARAGVELLELTAVPGGRTRVSYTFAVEPTGLPAPLAAVAAPAVRRTVAQGLAGLARHLERDTAQGRSR